MSGNANLMYYASAALAIFGTVGYHSFVKKIPAGIDPIISVIGIYVFAIILSVALIPLVVEKSDIVSNVRQIGWVQFAVACSVICIEVGFLLMYRSGWNLSIGNLVTGVAVNLALLAIGVALLREQLSAVNFFGVTLSIVGVALIGWK